MKITKEALKELIKEEIKNLHESPLVPAHTRAGHGQPEISGEEARAMVAPPAGQEKTLSSVDNFLAFIDTLIGKRMTEDILRQIKTMLQKVHPNLKSKGLRPDA